MGTWSTLVFMRSAEPVPAATLESCAASVCEELGLKVMSSEDSTVELSVSFHYLAGCGWSMMERVAEGFDDWADPAAIALSSGTAEDVVVVQIADSDAVCVRHLSAGKEVGRLVSPADGRGYFQPAPHDETSFARILREGVTIADLRGTLEQQPVFIDDTANAVLEMLGINPGEAEGAPATVIAFASDDKSVPASVTHPRFIPYGCRYFSREADSNGRLVTVRFATFLNEGVPTETAWIGVQGPLFERSLAKVSEIIIFSVSTPTGVHHSTGGNSAAMVQIPLVSGPPMLPMEGSPTARRKDWRAWKERLKASFSVGFVLEELRPGRANFFVTVEIPGLRDSMGWHWLEGEITPLLSGMRFTVRESEG